jgi:hypothetical protein
MDPFADLMKALQPVLAAAKPVFDVIDFIMALVDIAVKAMKILGALLIALVGPFNPISLLFPIDPVKDADGNPVDPYIPDVGSLLTGLLDALQKLICQGLKAASLLPQLSLVVTIKDVVLTVIQMCDAAMGQVNSLTDAFENLPPANTGNPIIDNLLNCAAENAKAQIENKLDPIAALAGILAVVSILSEIIKMPLPAPVVIMAKLMANQPPSGFGLIPFPNAQAREDFLAFLDDLAVNGIALPIPDFSNLADIPMAINDLKQSLEPIIGVLVLVGEIVDKLTKC